MNRSGRGHVAASRAGARPAPARRGARVFPRYNLPEVATIDSGAAPTLATVAEQLCRAGRRFDQRGWVLGTSGNFSAVLDRDPLRLAITRSAAFKGELNPGDILEMDEDARVIGGRGAQPSAEALLHVEIVRARHAGAVLHTHSKWSTLLSDACASAGGIAIEGYEMLKGLADVRTHEHREWLPIVENDQNIPRLAAVVRETLDRHPAAHGFLIRRHGLYTWGADLRDAVRHVEIVEFLLEIIALKTTGAGSWRS
jgi:methylthioribulose-1-phosphate dehydratase